MKRTFHGTIRFKRSVASVMLYGKKTTWTFAIATYSDFKHILGVRCREYGSGELDLTLRLIGTPMPWSDWEWSEDEEYQPNRMVIECFDAELWFDAFTPESSVDPCSDGRSWVMETSREEFDDIFPGLFDAIGEDNACEVEITVTARRRGNG